MKEQTAVKALIVKNNKFLMLKQNVAGKTWYTLPGGRVTSSDPENELKREVKEETGLDVDIIQHIGDWFFIRETDGTKTTCKTYLCKPTHENLDKSGSEDHEQIIEFIWITKKQFINGKYTDNQTLLNLISKTTL